MRILGASIIAGIFALSSSAIASAQEPSDQDSVFFVKTVTCQEVLAGSDEASGYAFVFLYGYVSGEADLDAQSSSEIEATIIEANAQCEVKPDEKAVEVFRGIMKPKIK